MQGEFDVGVGQCHADELINDVAHLNRIRLQEIAPCRHVEKKILHGYAGSHGALTGFLRGDLRPLDTQQQAHLAVVETGLHLHLCNGRDGGHRLASEAFGAQGEEVVRAADLAGGVPLEAHACIVLAHAAAIVNDLNEGAARIAHNEADAVGTCVNGVLQQFFDGRGWSLNDLSGSNLVGHRVGKQSDDV